MVDSYNTPAPCENEATCEPGKPHPGAGPRIRAATRGYGRNEPASDYPGRLPDRGENERLSAGRAVALSGRKARLLRQNPDSRHGPDSRLSRRGDYLPPRKDSRKSPTDSPGGVLPIQGVAYAVVLGNVLRVVNERGRRVLVPAAKKPLEKAWALDAGIGGWQNPSIRRRRLWHEINMREPHLAVNKAEIMHFGQTAGPAHLTTAVLAIVRLASSKRSAELRLGSRTRTSKGVNLTSTPSGTPSAPCCSAMAFPWQWRWS
jgi:hypothetical protein